MTVDDTIPSSGNIATYLQVVSGDPDKTWKKASWNVYVNNLTLNYSYTIKSNITVYDERNYLVGHIRTESNSDQTINL